MVAKDHQKSPEADGTRRLTRRRCLAAAAGTAGLSVLAGCSSFLAGNSGANALDAKVPKGTPASVETKYWHDWPTLDDEAQAEGPPLEYTARAGAPLEPVTMEFSSQDNPWMKQYALMMKNSVGSLGAPTRIIDRPLNQLYAQSWGDGRSRKRGFDEYPWAGPGPWNRTERAVDAAIQGEPVQLR